MGECTAPPRSLRATLPTRGRPPEPAMRMRLHQTSKTANHSLRLPVPAQNSNYLENGRLYHGYRRGIYMYPCDEVGTREADSTLPR
jgi:hypothetical protein